MPRNCYFIQVNDADSDFDDGKLYSIVTDPVQAEDAKPPYNEIRMSGQAEGQFLFRSALSKHLLPFVLTDPPLVVLPCLNRAGHLQVITSDHLRKQGFRDFASWMKRVEEHWQAARGAKADRQTVYERLDFQKELSEQVLNDPYLVLYNAAGTNLCAAVVRRADQDRPFVVEHKLYWAGFQNEDEAHYVAAFLNSEVPNSAIKPFQTVGLLGERDIEKKVLELPCPLFDATQSTHNELVSLAKTAAGKAAAALDRQTGNAKLGQRRASLRDVLATELNRIDDLVSRML